MQPENHIEIGAKRDMHTMRYGELVVYAIIFLCLVAAAFVVSIFLSRQSQQDAQQIFCATQQQRSWVSAVEYLEKVNYSIFMDGKDALPMLEQTLKEIQKFNRFTNALINGDTLEADGKVLEIKRITQPSLKRILDTIQAQWQPVQKDFDELAHTVQQGEIDTALFVKVADPILTRLKTQIAEHIRNFIVTLGFLSEDRINGLQSFQIGALLLSLLVFLAMAFRLSVSLRAQDRVISERTAQILEQNQKIKEQNELINEEKRTIEKLNHELESNLKKLRETQAYLIQNEKMSSLGQMVAGIAHELNTPIGYVNTNVVLIRERFTELAETLRRALRAHDLIYNDQFEEAVEEMQEIAKSPYGTIAELNEAQERAMRLLAASQSGLEQMAGLVRSMRNFSRLDEAEMKKADIHEGIKGSLLMLAPQFKHNDIQVTTQYGDLPMIECYPAQLNQVFLNLIQNAVHALEGRPEPKIHISTAQENNQIVVRISDNGPGIPKEIQSKIFDPFFTTKPVGKGTGLGLSIAYSIVQRHNGEISFETEAGKGTTFIIRIPIQDFIKPSELSKSQVAQDI
jgi:signal transduction histidine kinase